MLRFYDAGEEILLNEEIYSAWTVNSPSSPENRPEPGGISMRDMQVIFRSMMGVNAVGGDICEVSPPHDPIGITFVNVANMMFEMACLMATNRSK